ncbi:MAG: hypothetical protein AABY22_30915 [Nanoarchaeota archaeon]
MKAKVGIVNYYPIYNHKKMKVKIKLTDFKNQYGIKVEIERIEIDEDMKEVVVVCKSSGDVK